MKALPPSLYLPAVSLVAHAAEHRRPSGIMMDRTAHYWFEGLAAMYKGLPDPHPELINGIITRSMIIDYAVLDVLTRYKATVVDLGCGFSTRFHRLRPHIKAWNHLDLPEVIEVRNSFQKLSRSEMATACDLSVASFAEIPVDFNELFICEGVFNHLPQDKAGRLIKLLAGMKGWLIGTLMFESALERIKDNPEGLGTTFPLWGLSATFKLETFLEPAAVQRTWLLGKAARQLGLVRPEFEDEASGLVFIAKL